MRIRSRSFPGTAIRFGILFWTLSAVCFCSKDERRATEPQPQPEEAAATIRIDYDTANGVAGISWQPPSKGNAKAYYLYRSLPTDPTLTLNRIAVLRDTFYSDTLYRDKPDTWVNAVDSTIVIPKGRALDPWPVAKYAYAIKILDQAENVGPVSKAAEMEALPPTYVKTIPDLRIEGNYRSVYMAPAWTPLNTPLTFIYHFTNQGRKNVRVRWFLEDSNQVLKTTAIPGHEGTDTLRFPAPSVPGNFTIGIEAMDDAEKTWLTFSTMKAFDGFLHDFHGPDTMDISPDVKTLAPMPTSRAHLAAAVAGGKIYAIGGASRINGESGYPGDLEGLSNTEVYDPASDSWKILAPMPTPRFDLGLVASEGKIYAVGGMHKGVAQDTIEVYDPVTDSWTGLKLPKDPAYASTPGPIGNIGDTLFILMRSSTGSYGHLVPFLPDSIGWRPTASQIPMQWQREFPFDYRTAECGGRIYMAGKYVEYDYFFTYNASWREWERIVGMPQPVWRHSMASVDGKLYLTYGRNPANMSPAPALWNGLMEFDPVSKGWAQLPGFMGRMAGAMVGFNGKLYLLGGATHERTLDKVESLDRFTRP